MDRSVHRPVRRWSVMYALLPIFLAALILFSGLSIPEQASGQNKTKMIPATFADVVEKASPAVVNISTVKRTSKGGPGQFQGPFGEKDPMKEFFDRFFGGQPPQPQRKERALGTGFIIDPSGLIITNNHVVEGSEDILVRMSSGKEVKAEVLGRDPKTDLALIKIKVSRPLPYLKLGHSEKARIGDWVVAIGNPFGLEHTVTSGILSARGRVIGAGPYDDFLQTDASINPGNSGGPLINMDGEVIGINTAIVAGGQGIGFAIPADLAKGIVDQLKESGRVVRGWLGVMIQDLTPELAKSFKLDDQAGALVADVAQGGPAEKAGLKRGDVIISFNGREIKDSSGLPAVVAGTPVGTKVKVRVIRQGREKTLTVTIGELKDMKTAAVPAKTRGLGLSVRELSPELAERLGLSESQGVIIEGIDPSGQAAESGLKAGDLILEINRERINNMDDYRRVTGNVKKGQSVLFLIKRGPGTLFFTMKAE